MGQGMSHTKNEDGEVFPGRFSCGANVTKTSNLNRSPKFWAWTASIVLHLIVLSILVAFKFSPSEAQGIEWPVPMADVDWIKERMRTTPVVAKPKVEKRAGISSLKSPVIEKLTSQIFDASKSSKRDLADFAKLPASEDVFSIASSSTLPKTVEFFGSRTDQRKICYLVDCSGSMKGIFGQVKKRLKKSIAGLQPDQYFYIIFFGDNRLFEFGDGKLIRATEDAKSAAYDFIGLAQPAGQTNAMAALERAVQIRDNAGARSEIVYFLTDGFELTTEDTGRFNQRVVNLLKHSAPATRINTIGFWPQSDDRQMLRTIARQSGGEFVLIDDY